jgi:5'-3' exonuclease
MKTLIDGDSISYIIGWTCRNLDTSLTSYQIVLQTTDKFVQDILTATKCDGYAGFLGGVHPTFRHMLNSSYKANRGLTKPDWWNQWGGIINQRLRAHWKFYYVEGIEAEDAVGMIAHSLNYQDVTLAHIDKDLNQIPGIHYNYNTLVSKTISPQEAAFNLWKQVMTGDTTDNLPGLPGIGPKKAELVLNTSSFIDDYKHRTLRKFCDQLGEYQGMIQFSECYVMVKILTEIPPTLTFKPEDYPFIGNPAAEKMELFTSLTSSDDNASKYFVQQDPTPEGEDKQV